jgi:hypothetical protein
MAEPEADRRYIDEVENAEKAFGSLIATGGDAVGVLEFVGVPLDEAAQPLRGAVHGHAACGSCAWG